MVNKRAVAATISVISVVNILSLRFQSISVGIISEFDHGILLDQHFVSFKIRYRLISLASASSSILRD